MKIQLTIIYLLSMFLIFNTQPMNNKTELRWTEKEKDTIKKIQQEGLGQEDKQGIIDILHNAPWYTLEQATAQYKIDKTNKESIKNILKLAAPLKFLFTAIFLSNIYSLAKPFIEPFIQKHLGKFIFKNSIQPEKTNITFKNIAGYEAIKKRLKIIIKKIKNQKKENILEKIDGLLFYGEPGCGKTLMAQAIANEANVDFFNIKASDLINEEGVIGDRMKLLFEKIRAYVKSHGHCVLLIDEIDFLIANRNNGKLDNNEKIVLQDLLSLLDGTKALKGVLIIGNTNYKESIDIALLRNGRLGNHIEFTLPNINDIKKICLLQLKALNLEIDADFSIDIFSQKLLGHNVSRIIQTLTNIKDFIIENKYKLLLNNSLIDQYEIENCL